MNYSNVRRELIHGQFGTANLTFNFYEYALECEETTVVLSSRGVFFDQCGSAN